MSQTNDRDILDEYAGEIQHNAHNGVVTAMRAAAEADDAARRDELIRGALLLARIDNLACELDRLAVVPLPPGRRQGNRKGAAVA